MELEQAQALLITERPRISVPGLVGPTLDLERTPSHKLQLMVEEDALPRPIPQLHPSTLYIVT